MSEDQNTGLINANGFITMKREQIDDGLIDLGRIEVFPESPKSPPHKNQNKLGKRKRTDGKLYDPSRTFNLKWLKNPELRPWLRYVSHNKFQAKCKWCDVYLRAHLHDLRKHHHSKKHRRHQVDYMNNEKTYEFGILNFESSLIEEVIPELNMKPHIEEASVKSLKVEASPDVDSSAGFNPAKVGFIGCGSMAQALLSGFLKNGLIDADSLIVSAPSNKNLQKLQTLGVKTTHNNMSVLEESDVVFLCVKPHIIPEVLAELEPLEGSPAPLFVSVAAGLSIARLEAMLSHIVAKPRIIRTVPNTPSMVLQGCCVYSCGSNVQSVESNVVKCLLESVGFCEEIPEAQIDAACGLAGSGPAYIYSVIEAMADGGVKMGLPRALALSMAAHTVKGAASMVLETGKHPGQLKDEVCSPGGTTITAMHVLEKGSLRGTLMTAIEAAAQRSKELG